MNLLFFIHSLSSGGAERVTASLANHWAEQGWRLTVVTLAPLNQDFYALHPAVRRIALNMAGHSHRIPGAICRNLRRVAAMRRLLRKIRPDVAVGMMSSAGILLILAAIWIPKVAAIVSERTYPPMQPLSPLWSRLRRWTYPLADKVAMLTTEGLDWLNAEIPDARGVVVPNPVSFPLPSFEPRLFPDSVVEPCRRLVMAVGRLSVEKGFEDLLLVFSKVAPANPGWDLVILGEGPLRHALEMHVQTLGLRGRVFLPGRAGNVSDWYRRADLFVLSSRFEGFPNTLGEAMAHGCAVVSFDCETGPRDIIRHEVDGLLVAPGDAAGLEAALQRLMNNEIERRSFGERAINVRERYSKLQIAGLWETLFEEVRR